MNIINKLLSRTKSSNELSFIKSDEKREIVKAFSQNLKLTKREIKNLYLNSFLSVKKAQVDVKTFPFLFWLNGLISTFQLTVFSLFLLAVFFSTNKTLGAYYLGGICVLSISLIVYHTYHTMFRPVQILAQQYHFIGKYNNISN